MPEARSPSPRSQPKSRGQHGACASGPCDDLRRAIPEGMLVHEGDDRAEEGLHLAVTSIFHPPGEVTIWILVIDGRDQSLGVGAVVIELR
jgi:hypothetical protein